MLHHANDITWARVHHLKSEKAWAVQIFFFSLILWMDSNDCLWHWNDAQLDVAVIQKSPQQWGHKMQSQVEGKSSEGSRISIYYFYLKMSHGKKTQYHCWAFILKCIFMWSLREILLSWMPISCAQPEAEVTLTHCWKSEKEAGIYARQQHK